MSVSSELDAIQVRLFDSAVLWPRAELLDWLNDGYADLCTDSGATRRFWILDVPGRVTFSYTFEWETADQQGSHWRWSNAMEDASKAGSALWESPHLESGTVEATRIGITQPWERCYTGETDNRFLFALPADHEKICRVAWDERRLTPVAVKQLDQLWTWNRLVGEPIVWTGGLQRVRSFEVFEIRTDYQQAYELLDAVPRLGTMRFASGSRTYSTSMKRTIPNAWAYSSDGDMDGVSHQSVLLGPSSAVTADCDLEDAPGDYPYRFTMCAGTDSQDEQGLGLGFYGTQPWEIGNRGSGRTLGMWEWEKIGGLAVLAQTSEYRPKIAGMGRRFTKQASDPTYFATNTWEIEELDGDITDADAGTTGVLVGLFSWEILHGATVAVLPVGGLRGASSPDRQYLPIEYEGGFFGCARDWKSSTLALQITQVFLPAFDLGDDTDEFMRLLPSQAAKYLRHYVWSRCFARQGEGHQPQLASHYAGRFQLGVQLFRKLLDTAQRDRDWSRAPLTTPGYRPPRVRLPSNFPRVW